MTKEHGIFAALVLVCVLGWSLGQNGILGGKALFVASLGGILVLVWHVWFKRRTSVRAASPKKRIQPEGLLDLPSGTFLEVEGYRMLCVIENCRSDREPGAVYFQTRRVDQEICLPAKHLAPRTTRIIKPGEARWYTCSYKFLTGSM